ncbi:MAG: 2,4-dihydroxyhept-2-ene-1,7-dioic acid aldolase [Alphaproteobacteria bacterium]|nr:2,4-dihydroxyhept-2-ene-1,7-dioic acid aldolase [Alphaproteobacteria bacterium]
MKENNVRKIWDAGGCVVNGWLAIPSGFAAEVMAQGVAGLAWDSLTVDMQHGVQDYGSAIPCWQAIATTGVTPLVRVPWLDEGAIMKSLDGGAMGVICPMINTADQAKRLVEACRYPPLGQRSFGPIRAGFYGADYQPAANASVVVMAMIETQQALDNLDAILSTKGLDGIYIGPADLSLSLTGKVGFDHAEGTVQYDAIMGILEKCKKHGVKAGIHTGSGDYAKKMAGKGFQFTTIGSDSRLMQVGMQVELAKVKTAGGTLKSGPY